MTARVLVFLACSALLAQQPVGYSGSNAQFQARHPRYQIEPGDVIELQFLPTAEYNQTVTVQPDGYITLREAGDLYVRGKTVPELRQLLGAAYSKILYDPEITVVLKDFDKPYFTATGQVGHPGKYDLRADTTVTEALAIAGGTTEKSKDSQVLLFRRVSNDWVETKVLDVKAIYKGQFQEDVHLRPGDMLFVPQNRISKIKPYLPVWALSTYMNPAGGL
jgi:polysaccharide export outer membrane protein